MIKCNRKHLDLIVFKKGGDLIKICSQFKVSKAEFYGHLPQAGNTDKAIIPDIRDGFTTLLG